MAVDHDGVVIETVKQADDGSGDVIVRCYESWGGRAPALITPGFGWSTVRRCDARERPIATPDAGLVVESGPSAAGRAGPGPVSVLLRPFEIVTLRFGP